jgi:hypothetical protein
MTDTELCSVLQPPVGGAVRPGNDQAFVYVLRDDTSYIARELRKRLGVAGEADAVDREIVAAYKVFLAGLYEAFAAAATPGGHLELHVYSSQEVERVRSELLMPTAYPVALDPLCESPDAFHLGLSRWYLPGGFALAGEGFRPGFASVADQLADRRDRVGSQPVALIEDDMYTGDTLAATIQDLRAADINVRQVVVGIQICQSDLKIDGVQTAAAVRYLLDGQRALSDQIDLGDPRDYLIGLSGLVILLGSSESEPSLGRAPYVLPFVRPSDRASLPVDSDWPLSRTVLQLSQDFYRSISDQVGEDIRVAHCDPEFVSFAKYQLGTNPDEKMVNFIDQVMTEAHSIADRLFGVQQR